MPKKQCKRPPSVGSEAERRKAEAYLRRKIAKALAPVPVSGGQIVNVTIPPSIPGDPCAAYRTRAIGLLKQIDQTMSDWNECRRSIVQPAGSRKK